MSKAALADRLRINGATEAEIRFLLDGRERSGRRCELNSMTSRQFIDLIETKLTEHGVTKVVPEPAQLAGAYRLYARGKPPAEKKSGPPRGFRVSARGARPRPPRVPGYFLAATRIP